MSTAEAEWYAASEAGKEVKYLRAIMEQLRFTQHEPTELYEDSRAEIAMAENPVQSLTSHRYSQALHRKADRAGTSNFDPMPDRQNGSRCLDEGVACSCI